MFRFLALASLVVVALVAPHVYAALGVGGTSASTLTTVIAFLVLVPLGFAVDVCRAKRAGRPVQDVLRRPRGRAGGRASAARND